MAPIPAARFEDSATEQGSRGIVRRVGAFVEAYGVGSGHRDQIAGALSAILAAATRYALAGPETWIAVTADVMPADVQLVLRLCQPESLTEGDPTGGFELWISFPRQ